jgi:hypothetical protein
MSHGDAREGKWRGNWRMNWVASTLHTNSEHGVSSITTADAHTSAASSRLNWRLRRFKWTRPFRRKTKSGFCSCAITFQTQSNRHWCFWRDLYFFPTTVVVSVKGLYPQWEGQIHSHELGTHKVFLCLFKDAFKIEISNTAGWHEGYWIMKKVGSGRNR